MGAGTPAETPAGTPDGNEYLPPCRQAEVFITTCPRCDGEMRLKTLRYTQKCGRSFDPTQRAREQQAAAAKAINTIMASRESAERNVKHTAQQNVDKQNKYAKLILYEIVT